MNHGLVEPRLYNARGCKEILEKYSLWEKLPVRVRDYLLRSYHEDEASRLFPNASLHYCMVVKSRDLLEDAASRSRTLGVTPILLTSFLTGESREVGRTIAAIAANSDASRPPIPI